MKISIFGIGYVGCVSAACFAHAGHDVIGVDVNPTKVDIINSGKSPIVEPQMNELIHDVVKAGKLRATTDSIEAVKSSDISLVCVGTPSKPNGSLNLEHVAHVCEEIGAALATKDNTSHDRHSQHDAAGQYRERGPARTRKDFAKESRKRLRRVCEPGVSA